MKLGRVDLTLDDLWRQSWPVTSFDDIGLTEFSNQTLLNRFGIFQWSTHPTRKFEKTFDFPKWFPPTNCNKSLWCDMHNNDLHNCNFIVASKRWVGLKIISAAIFWNWLKLGVILDIKRPQKTHSLQVVLTLPHS